MRLHDLLRSLASDFTGHAKSNIINVFKQAEAQITEYKKAFENNFTLLNEAIQMTLAQIKQDTNTKNDLEARKVELIKKLKKIDHITTAVNHILDF